MGLGMAGGLVAWRGWDIWWLGRIWEEGIGLGSVGIGRGGVWGIWLGWLLLLGGLWGGLGVPAFGGGGVGLRALRGRFRGA